MLKTSQFPALQRICVLTEPVELGSEARECGQFI